MLLRLLSQRSFWNYVRVIPILVYRMLNPYWKRVSMSTFSSVNKDGLHFYC
jgi:hypothetical protein